MGKDNRDESKASEMNSVAPKLSSRDNKLEFVRALKEN